MLFPPVIHNFRYNASVEHGNEYHIKRKSLYHGVGNVLLTKNRISLKKMYHKVN